MSSCFDLHFSKLRYICGDTRASVHECRQLLITVNCLCACDVGKMPALGNFAVLALTGVRLAYGVAVIV